MRKRLARDASLQLEPRLIAGELKFRWTCFDCAAGRERDATHERWTQVDQQTASERRFECPFEQQFECPYLL